MSDTLDINTLFDDEDRLSDAARDALVVTEAAPQLQEALQLSIDDVPYSEVILLTQMPDDSGSIASAGQEQVVCDGHNGILRAVAESAQQHNVLAMTMYLNGRLLFPYAYLDEVLQDPATLMGAHNYDAHLGTPLYDNTVGLLRAVLAESLRFERNGVPVRTITVLLTDGEDMSSRQYRAKDVRAIVEDMRRMENHLILALGIGRERARFRQVFQEMGIPDAWIITPGADAHAIRAAFNLVSQSVARASQNAAAFRQALGGNATPMHI